MNPELFLYEQYLHFTLHGRNGSPTPGVAYLWGLGGAMLADLFARRLIDIEVRKDRAYVVRAHSGTTRRAVLDDGLVRIREKGKPAPMHRWVGAFAGQRIWNAAADGLCGLRTLRREEKRVLFRTQVRYFEARPEVGEAALAYVRHAAWVETGDQPWETVTLLSLVYRSRAFRHMFGKKETQSVKQRVESLIAGEVFGLTVADSMARTEI